MLVYFLCFFLYCLYFYLCSLVLKPQIPGDECFLLENDKNYNSQTLLARRTLNFRILWKQNTYIHPYKKHFFSSETINFSKNYTKIKIYRIVIINRIKKNYVCQQCSLCACTNADTFQLNILLRMLLTHSFSLYNHHAGHINNVRAELWYPRGPSTNWEHKSLNSLFFGQMVKLYNKISQVIVLFHLSYYGMHVYIGEDKNICFAVV